MSPAYARKNAKLITIKTWHKSKWKPISCSLRLQVFLQLNGLRFMIFCKHVLQVAINDKQTSGYGDQE